MLPVPVVLLDPELPLLAYAQHGDAGADLRAREDVTLSPRGGRALVPTGLAVAIPEGHVGLIHPRSGLALKHGVTVLNAPGTIDAGYRDEVKVLLVNHDPERPYEIKRGDRIAQLIVQAVEEASWQIVESFDGIGRGGGFGSTGR